MFSKKNKYINYVHVYIICTNIWFTCLCFYCKCSMRISISIQSGKLAVQMSPANSHCYNSISCRHAEANSERSWSSAGAHCVVLTSLYSCGLSGCSEHLDTTDVLPALSGWASELTPTWVCLQELQSWRKLLHSMPWNTDYSKKCILHLFLLFPHHSFILAFSL